MSAESPVITLVYSFIFSKDNIKDLKISLSEDSLELITEKKESYPYWTELDYFSCPVCPLNKETNKYCPIASNLCDLIHKFYDAPKEENIQIKVITRDRIYYKKTTLQSGLQSLVGIYMVTSGCPIMEKLKPLVKFHLPFASEDETNFRILSMYILAQFFKYKKGMEPDMDLKNFIKIYDDIRAVNRNFQEKLKPLELKDSAINALMGLDCFAFSISYIVNTDNMDKLEKLFDSYLR